MFELRSAPGRLLLHANAAFGAAPLHRKALARLSFGAVAENLVVRGARLGYRVGVSEARDATDSSLIASLDLERVEPFDSPHETAIASRYTNRALRYRGPPLPAADLQALSRLADGLDGVTVSFADQDRGRVMELVRIAETARFGTRALHAELFSAIRFDVGWRDTASEGLPPAALGVEPPLRSAFAQLRHWGLMRRLRLAGVHRMLGRRAAWLPCLLSPHVGVVYTRASFERGAFAAGRALQRVWLEVERRGLALQPLAASTVLALPSYEEVPTSVRETLSRGWRALSEATPVIVFRLGRAARPAVRAGRPPPAPIASA
jgi:hypothetical protein